jgi:hypothetical protein
MTESQLIDYLLDELKTRQDKGALPQEDFLKYPAAIDRMRALGLIEGEGRSKRLLQRGFEVLDAGGIDAWLAANRQRESRQERMAIDTLKASQSSTRATVIAAVAAVVSIGINFYQLYQTSEKDEQIKQLTATVQTLKQQAERQPASPEQTTSPAGSLSTPKSLTR